MKAVCRASFDTEGKLKFFDTHRKAGAKKIDNFIDFFADRQRQIALCQWNLCLGTSIAQAANARGAGRLCNEQAILKSDTLTTSTTKKNKI